MAQCSLALHPQKTKIVYCRDENRRECFSVHQFDFLGFCFRQRFARSRAGSVIVSFLPAILTAAEGYSPDSASMRDCIADTPWT
jgi:RNA-directed DNA polymerase